MNIGDILLDEFDHFGDLEIGAAVFRALESAYTARYRGICISPARGERAGDEGGVVAAAVPRVADKAYIEQFRLFVGKLFIRPYRAQYCLSGREFGLERMNIHALVVIMSALDLIGVCHYRGQLGDEIRALPDDIVKVRAVGILIK